MSVMTVNTSTGEINCHDDISSLLDGLNAENRQMEQRDQELAEQLRSSLADPPLPHFQPTETTNDRMAFVPICPRCKIIDVRFVNRSRKSRLVVTENFCGSGQTICCVPCSNEGTNLYCFHFYNGQTMSWNDNPPENCFKLSEEDYATISREIA